MNNPEALESLDTSLGPDPDHIETVREAWTSYVAAAYPHGIGLMARRELRRAFYMGAWAMLCDLAEASQFEPPGGQEAMKRLWDEISDFVDQVRANRD
jgi:hypothetical protein